jgi:hypothetical protein
MGLVIYNDDDAKNYVIKNKKENNETIELVKVQNEINDLTVEKQVKPIKTQKKSPRKNNKLTKENREFLKSLKIKPLLKSNQQTN